MKSDSNVDSLTEEDEQEKFFNLISEDNEDEIKKIFNSQNVYEIWYYKNKENNNSTIIHITVYRKNLSILKILIEYIEKHKGKEFLKTFINEQNDTGVTPLHLASFKGNINVINYLLEHGADESIITKRKLNIFHYSAQGNKPSSLMFFYLRFKNNNNTNLLKYITDEDEGGSTPLHWAAYSSAEECLLYLINLDIFRNEEEKQEFLDKQDNEGATALHLCVKSNSSRIAMKLLQHGAKTGIRNNKNQTAYDLAFAKKYNEICNLIKSNEECQFCRIKAPVKKIKKSKQNIIIIIISQIITNIILFFSIIPIALNFSNVMNYFLFIFFIFLLFIFILIFILLLLINLGIVPPRDLSDLNTLLSKNKDLTKYCYKCFIKKTRSIRHCFICNLCYDEFDHHCYWINKCVAKNNYNLFISFLCTTFFYLVLVLLLGIFGLYYIIVEGVNSNFDIYLKQSIKEYLFKDDLYYLHFCLSIFLIVLCITFLIPETLLLILHLKYCATDYKSKKKRTTTTTMISSSRVDSLLDPNNKNKI